MSSLLYGPGSETLAVIVLNSQELGRIGPTAALSVAPRRCWSPSRRCCCGERWPGCGPVGASEAGPCRMSRAARGPCPRGGGPRRGVRRDDGAARGQPRRRAGRGAGAARPLRVGEVDAAARGRGVPGAARGDGPARRPDRGRRRASRARRSARDIAVVFQNYALWPHLSAVDTVAYPGATARRRRARRPAPRRSTCWSCCGSRTWPSGGRRSCPAASSSASGLAPGAGPAPVGLPVRRADRPPRHPRARGVPRGAGGPPAGQRGGRRLRHARRGGGPRPGRPGRAAARRDGSLQVGTPRQVYAEPVDLFAARLTGPASVIDAPDGTGRRLVRPGWARLGGPLEGRLRAVWFRGPHSDHLVDTPLGEVLIREPGPPQHAVGGVHRLDPGARLADHRLAVRTRNALSRAAGVPANGCSGR